jgi:hypothetical protein
VQNDALSCKSLFNRSCHAFVPFDVTGTRPGCDRGSFVSRISPPLATSGVDLTFAKLNLGPDRDGNAGKN